MLGIKLTPTLPAIAQGDRMVTLTCRQLNQPTSSHGSINYAQDCYVGGIIKVQGRFSAFSSLYMPRIKCTHSEQPNAQRASRMVHGVHTAIRRMVHRLLCPRAARPRRDSEPNSGGGERSSASTFKPTLLSTRAAICNPSTQHTSYLWRGRHRRCSHSSTRGKGNRALKARSTYCPNVERHSTIVTNDRCAQSRAAPIMFPPRALCLICPLYTFLSPSLLHSLSSLPLFCLLSGNLLSCLVWRFQVDEVRLLSPDFLQGVGGSW